MRACVLALVLAMAAMAARAEPASWLAVSKTAMAITGDIVLDDNKLTFANGSSLHLEPYEMSREGDWADDDTEIAGDVFKIDPAANPELMNGNKFCDAPASYIVLWSPTQDELTVSVYTGDAAPIGDSKLDRLCATYSYETP